MPPEKKFWHGDGVWERSSRRRGLSLVVFWIAVLSFAGATSCAVTALQIHSVVIWGCAVMQLGVGVINLGNYFR